MSSLSQPLTISLTLAKPTDISILNHISILAFSTDTHTRLKNASKPPTETFSMTDPLRSWFKLQKGKFRAVMAVVDGEVVGWTAWIARGFEFDDHGEGEREERRDRDHQFEKKQEQEEEPVQEKIEEKEEQVSSTPFPNPNISELESITNASMQEYQKILMPTATTRCLILCAISVLPAYQGKGIGSAMIQWGTRVADEKGVFCWVQSSDTGWKAFEKNGFREVGRLVVELDAFCGGLRNEASIDGSGRWGEYVFRYMRREER